jgi:tetratricopeptide (TPR) repeat protein
MVLKSKALAIFLVLVASLIAYGQVINFTIGRFDEVGMIEQNLVILRDSASVADVVQQDPFFRNPALNFYRPLQNVSLLIDAKLGKGKPRAFHVTNLLIHAVTAIVLLLALNLLVDNLLLSTLLALVFAVNPIFAQAIAWVPGRGDLLVGLFGALMVYGTLRDPHLQSKKFLLLVSLSAGMAVFAKETAILFPIVFLATLVLAGNYKPWKSRNVLVALGFILASGASYLWARSVVIKQTTPGNRFGVDVLLENLRVVPEIVSKFFIPYGLQPMASYTVLATVSGLVIMAGVMVLVFRSKELRPRLMALAGGAWFLIFTVPGAMFHHADGAAAYDYLEHRVYLPAIGLMILVAALLMDNVSSKKWNNISSSMALVALVYLVVAFVHVRNYATPIAFYDKAVSANPRSSLALTNRGLIREQRGDLQGAIDDYSAAIAIDPRYAQAYVNRGNRYGAVGNRQQAKSDYLNAIKYKPTLFAARYNLGNYYLDDKQWDSAYAQYSEAARLNPKFAQTHALLGITASMMGNNLGADGHLTTSLSIDPRNAQVWLARGKVRFALNNRTGAKADFMRSSELGNTEAQQILQQNTF